jgi:EmrB/QacA subfamily drug resistance transporter
MDQETIHARRWWTLAVLCFSLLVIGMDNTILNVALPTIQRDLGATASQLQWIVDAYTIVYASILLTTGSLGDRFGRKHALSAGLVVFGIGSVLCATAATSGQLISYRIVAGVGAAMIMPATLSILSNVFGPEERGRAIGIWAGVSGLGVVAGPLFGGWLLGHYAWGSVFLINIPVVLVALVAGRFLVPDSKDPSAPRLDLVGTVLGALGLGALLYGIIQAPSEGWGDPWVVAAFVTGLVVLGTFLVWELRSDHPMLEVRFFRNPRFGAASIAVTLVFFAMFGASYFLTQYLQYVLGYSPMAAGAALVPLALAMMIAAPRSARITRRFGTKLAVSGGMVVIALALLLLAFVKVDSSYPYIGLVGLVLGTGLGVAMSPATESIMGAVPREKAGIGSAMNDTTRQVGGALGVAVLGSITAAQYHASIATSPAMATLPATAQAAAHDSIGGAAAVAGQMGAAGNQLLTDASHAFVSAMSVTVLIAAGVALAGALVAFLLLPARPPLEAPEADIEAELEAQGLLAADPHHGAEADQAELVPPSASHGSEPATAVAGASAGRSVDDVDVRPIGVPHLWEPAIAD